MDVNERLLGNNSKSNNDNQPESDDSTCMTKETPLEQQQVAKETLCPNGHYCNDVKKENAFIFIQHAKTIYIVVF